MQFTNYNLYLHCKSELQICSAEMKNKYKNKTNASMNAFEKIYFRLQNKVMCLIGKLQGKKSIPLDEFIILMEKEHDGC